MGQVCRLSQPLLYYCCVAAYFGFRIAIINMNSRRGWFFNRRIVLDRNWQRWRVAFFARCRSQYFSHRCVFRILFGVNDHGCDCDCWLRPTPQSDPFLSPIFAMVWWDGDHRTRRRDFTRTWYRWDAALSSRNPRTSQRYQSHSTDCRNRKALWYIYLSLTIACASAFWLAGMSLFDAICHSFSTIAIGGFSTHDASMGYFDSYAINLITVVFLLISSCNFTLHYAAFATGGVHPKYYWRDPEFRAFFVIQVLLFVICFSVLLKHHSYDSFYQAFDQALFQTVSISTTAGFTTTGFADWPLFLPVLLLFSSFIGGCAGSTGGGMKVIRVLLLTLQGLGK